MKQILVATYFIAAPALCMAMADNTPPVYGRPTLYGEYEIGGVDKNYSRPTPIRMASKRVTAKQPVKNKKVKPKKFAKNAKSPKLIKSAVNVPVEKVAVKVELAPTPVAVSEPKTKEPVKPAPTALIIADAANIPDVSDFCTQRKALYKGQLPDGVVLMPGRPDLMSCGEIQK